MNAVARAPRPLRDLGFGALGGVVHAAYYLPGGPLRRMSGAFGEVLGQGSPSRLHRAFVRRYVLGQRRMEMLRLGQTAALDAMTRIPEEPRLTALLSEGNGLMVVMPHCHASILAVRALAVRHPTLLLVRATVNETRAVSQRSYYQHLGCTVLDVQRVNDLSVARAVYAALRKGQIVVGVVDLIKRPPRSGVTHNKAKDIVRAMAFGQPIGAVGWPARFAAKCGAPILPLMIAQTPEAIELHLGKAIVAGDVEATTQAWTDAMEDFIRAYPHDWLFVYDKTWARVLQDASKAKTAAA